MKFSIIKCPCCSRQIHKEDAKPVIISRDGDTEYWCSGCYEEAIKDIPEEEIDNLFKV